MFSVYPSETSVAAVIVKSVFRILDEDNAEQEPQPPAFLMVNPDIGQLIGSIVSKKSEHDSIVSGEATL